LKRDDEHDGGGCGKSLVRRTLASLHNLCQSHFLVSTSVRRFAIVDLVRVGRVSLVVGELVILSVLILATRCANRHDVFIDRNIYFTDADCYARMTRVRLCAAQPGLILRHHNFENYPAGTTPHTTAPLDYSILGLSILLKPFAAQPIDLAGALISPLLALAGGWFLWWWSRRMEFRYRWILLILYAISPILVHGTGLGRPDHQSLLMLLVTVAVCAEWSFWAEGSTSWSIVTGAAWALAIWVSVYEPFVLLALVIAVVLLEDRQSLFRKERNIGWIVAASIVVIAFAIEQRIPSLSIFHRNELFRNWLHTIGELVPVSPLNPIWFRWAGYMIVVGPILIWFGYRKKIQPPLFINILLIVTLGLTIWQARWSYFFISIFAVALPALLEPIKSRAVVWIAFILSILPILRDWDERLWPNESVLAMQIEHRNESEQLRELASTIRSSETHPFLAPWWLSPEIAYWSGQPGVAGSSHESLDGIADSARFFLAEDQRQAGDILLQHKVDWVVAYDSDRVTSNSAAILGTSVPERPLGRFLDRTPAQAPPFLVLAGQNQAGKILKVVNNR
jgi:hypothetical protein